jgi:hypothetical protein
MAERIKPADTYFYLKGTEYCQLIGSYAALKALKLTCDEDKGKYFEGGGMERNHLIPGSFFKNGPPATKHLYDYIPTLPLQRKEHRGSAESKSFHNQKGFGMNDYLRSKGLAITKRVCSFKDIEDAIAACREWYVMIGMNYVAAAIDEFNERFYMPASRAKAAHAGH